MGDALHESRAVIAKLLRRAADRIGGS
jgi:hypothetical protein